MTKRMLINARNPLELRVAVTTDKTLDDLKIDVAERGLTRGNIYFGKISNIQPSLNAAFIDYGAERNGFLTIQDVVEEAYYKDPKTGQRPRIEDVLEEGRPIVVQITREPEGQKGAALTTNLSLAGRYLVLTPFDSTRGVSRKVDDDETRRELKKIAAGLKVPEGGGFIVRTNALGQNKTTLNRDLNALLRLWKRIAAEAKRSKKRGLLYSDQDIVLQALRDYLDTSVEEVLVDEENAFKKAQEYIRAFMPRSRTKLIHYEDPAPIFSRYDLEAQIDRIYMRSAPLPSGGSIVIDPTEALTAIDVNSGRATKAASQEETAHNTNLEAAVEVARQLRLRDIGGLVVVDFIDMRSRKNQRQVEKALVDALKPDKARSTVSRISANGLVEINRQRIQQAIQLRTHRICPTCTGTGRVPSPDLLALHVLRELQARCSDGSIERVKISLHPEMADALQNHRRKELSVIEDEFDVRIEVHSSLKLGRSEKDIDWFARAQLRRSAITRRGSTPAALTDTTEDSRNERRRPSRHRETATTTSAAASAGDGQASEGTRGGKGAERRAEARSDSKSEAKSEARSEGKDEGRDDRSSSRSSSRRRRRSSRGRGRGRSGDQASRREGKAEDSTNDREAKDQKREEQEPARSTGSRSSSSGDGRSTDSADASASADSHKASAGESNGEESRERRSRRRRPRRRRPTGRSENREGEASSPPSDPSPSESSPSESSPSGQRAGAPENGRSEAAKENRASSGRDRSPATEARSPENAATSDDRSDAGNGNERPARTRRAPEAEAGPGSPGSSPLPDYVPRPPSSPRSWSRSPSPRDDSGSGEE